MSLMFASLLAAADGGFWSSPMFAKDNWEDAMNFLRIGLPLAGALLLIYELRARKLQELIDPILRRNIAWTLAGLGVAAYLLLRFIPDTKLNPNTWLLLIVAAILVGVSSTKKRFAIGLSALAFGAYFDFGNPNVRYSEYYHRHEFFHYYLGSKYSRELGYERLYECAAIAEVELGRGAQVRRRELRDLSVNLIKKTENTYVFSDPGQCKDHFSAATWEAFKKDVDWFYRSSMGSYWENMQKDHGYNPPPVWTMEGKIFSSLGVAGDKFFKALSGIDVLLQLGTVVLMFWAFGWRVGAVATVFWGCNAPANFYWTGGAFIRQDWIFFLVASVCLARKRYFGLSGAALTWSALLRVFPLILFVGPLIVIGFHLVKYVRKQRAEGKPLGNPMQWLTPQQRRFVGGCIVAGGILIPASVIAAGPDSYRAFVHHIRVHKDTPLTNHMGLETMLVHDWKGRMRFTRDDNLDDPFQGWKEGRTDRFKTMRGAPGLFGVSWLRFPVFQGILLILGLWTLWALRRTKLLWMAMPLGLPLAMSLTNLTCYYYSMYMIAAVIVAARPQFGPAMLATSAASQILLLRYYWVDDKYTAQSYLFMAFSLLILYAYSRPFSMERLKAWWHGQPEPQSEPPPLAEPKLRATAK